MGYHYPDLPYPSAGSASALGSTGAVHDGQVCLLRAHDRGAVPTRRAQAQGEKGGVELIFDL